MRVLVAKTGGPWSGSVSVLSSQQNHTAIARYLQERGHEVLCIGRIPEELGYGLQCEPWTIKPIAGLDANLKIIREWIQRIVAWKPDVLVNATGGGMSCLSPRNPRGVIIPSSGWRYSWPIVELLAETKLPRIIAVTDVRCYPREHEVNYVTKPCAVLSQETRKFSQRVLDKKWTCRGVHAVGMESLRLRWSEKRNTRERAWDCTVLAHAHDKDQRIARDRTAVWDYILRDVRQDVGLAWRIVGEGWGDLGTAVPGSQVACVLESSRTCPMVGMGTGWSSPKYAECLLAGCVPLPYARDLEALYAYGSPALCPWEHETRFASPGELLSLIKRARDDVWREDVVSERLAAISFECPLLLDAVEHFGRGGEEDHEKYGGYACTTL